MSGVEVRGRQTSAQRRHSFSRERHWGTWGLWINSAFWTQAGTTFPAPDLSPNANTHSATEAHTCPLQTGTCSGPEPFSQVPDPDWGGDCLLLTPVPQPSRQTALPWGTSGIILA